MNLRAGRFAAAALAALIAVGCSDSQGEGHGVLGLNESDHDVVVRIQTSGGGSFLLRAGTWGTVSYGFDPRKGDILVFDVDCRPIATLAWTRADVTVRIAPDGNASVTEQGPMPSGIRRVDHVDGGPSSSIRPC
jgi:hypothetical protein